MLQLAIADIPGFMIDDREIQSEAISYTVNSLTAIRNEVGNKPICLILGLDAFSQIASWHKAQELISLAHIVILDRPEAMLTVDPFIETLLKNKVADPSLLHQRPAGLLYFESNAALDISATLIRQMIQQGLSPRFLLPDSVLHYIKTHGLYHATK
jgi:nicotinate-nucleotide adenylyltransferase